MNCSANEVKHPTTPGFFKRNVIIQKDGYGFGLTVSGDNPVYVQLVKEGSAAEKAGVQVGDQIIKVNGTLVTQSNHIEVVSLIKTEPHVAIDTQKVQWRGGTLVTMVDRSCLSQKSNCHASTVRQCKESLRSSYKTCGSYVALTLLGKDNNSRSPTENRPNRLSGGHLRSRSLGNSFNAHATGGAHTAAQGHQQTQPSSDVGTVNNDRANDVERMLNQEREFNKTILEKYRRAPSPKTQHKLAESKTRITFLEKQLSALTSQTKNPPTLYRPNSQPTDPQQQLRPHSQSPDIASLNRSNSATSTTSYNSTITNNSSYSGGGRSTDRSDSIRESLSSYGGRSTDRSDSIRSDSIRESISSYAGSSPPPPYQSQSSYNSTSSVSTVTSMNEVKRMKVDANTEQQQMPNFGVLPNPPPDMADPSQLSFDMLFANQAKQIDQQPDFDDQIMSMEDGEFSDEECIDQHGPFESIDLLKDKKAHLAIFLHYLISNSDPTPLYFWVVTEIYSKELKPDTNVKEWKKWAYEIYSTFVAPSSPLKVDIGGDMEEKIIAEAINDPRTSEERLKDIFSVARSRLDQTLEQMLSNFRMRRMIGLGGMFGDGQLADNMDRNAELKIIETTLMPHLETLLGKHDSSSDIQNDKNIAMASAIATLMKSAGLGKNLQKGTTALDRCRSFAEKEKGYFMNLRNKTRKITCMGHMFVGTQYSAITNCNVCGGLLWGIGIQGMQCTALNCEFNVHRKNCMDNITESCNKTKLPKSQKPLAYMGKGGLKYEPDENTNPNIESKPNTPTFPDEKSGITPASDIDVDDTLDSEKDPDSRTGTPHEEPPQSTPSTKRMGMRPRKVPLKNVHRSNSDKNTKPPNRIRIPGGKPENGVTGQGPYPGRVDSPESEEEDISGSDVDNESTWSTTADKKIIKKLKSKEIKRQEVIHELLHTEKSHVRKLKILERVFYRRILRSNLLSKEEVHDIFPNLENLIEIHQSLLDKLKEREKENEVIENIGDIMVERFGGEAGEHVKTTCAEFCRNQKNALEKMKVYVQTRKDFGALITKCEESRHCNRLDFAAILANTHHRLVKYPLLLDNLNKATPQGHSDYKKVEESARYCKDILNYVNDEIKRVEDELRIIELSKKIEDRRTIKDNDQNNDNDGTDQAPGTLKAIKKFNIMNHKLLYEGNLLWKVNTNKSIELHCVLLDDTLLLLTRSDEKYILKTYTTTTSSADTKVQSPVVHLSGAFIREVAIDKKAFFLVDQSPQIYELSSQTHADKKKWVEKLNSSIEMLKAKSKEGGSHRVPPHPSSTPTSPTPPPPPAVTPTTPTDMNDDIKEVPTDEEEEARKPADEVTGEPDIEEASTDVLSKEKLDNLNNKLNENEGSMKQLISERSSILTELHGPKYMESMASRLLQPTDIVTSAFEQVEQLTEIFDKCSTSAPDDQKESFSKSVSGLHQYLYGLLQAVCDNSRHDSYADSTDGGKDSSDTRPCSKRTSSKTYSSDMTDSLPRQSPLGDAILGASPPPILVSEDYSLEEYFGLSESPKKHDDSTTSHPGSANPPTPTKLESTINRTDNSPKLEAGLLILDVGGRHPDDIQSIEI